MTRPAGGAPMRTSITLLLLLIAVALGPVIRAQNQRGMPEPVIPAALGVNIHFTGEPKADLDLLRSGGFRWARMDLFWEQVERRRGVYDFSAYDTLVSG